MSTIPVQQLAGQRWLMVMTARMLAKIAIPHRAQTEGGYGQCVLEAAQQFSLGSVSP